jgi:hypothetical protein
MSTTKLSVGKSKASLGTKLAASRPSSKVSLDSRMDPDGTPSKSRNSESKSSLTKLNDSTSRKNLSYKDGTSKSNSQDGLSNKDIIITSSSQDEFSFALPETLHEDALPIFFSSATVELFHFKDLCSELKPYTIMKKTEILADLFNRAAVSDFHPVKAKVNVGRFLLLSILHHARVLVPELPKPDWRDDGHGN